MSLVLQNKVEAFLNKGEIIMFEMEDDIAVMTIFFGNAEFGTYSNPKNHRDLIKYFKNRKITLVIVSYDEKVDISFVDMHTGDTLNIKQPKLVKGNYHKLFLDIPKNKNINFILAGLSTDGSTMVLPPVIPTEPIKIRGYSVTDRRTSQ